jgi:cobalt/nickel transport protein
MKENQFMQQGRLDMTRFQKKLWIGLLIMALLTPLGIYLPEKFKSGDAWGEWGTDKLKELLGYVPAGLRKFADFWKAPVRDYNFGGEGAAFSTQIISYIISGILGIAAVVIAIYVITKFMGKHEK